MKKIIKVVDKEKRIVQITTTDERFYGREITNKITGLPVGFEYVPSVTFITGSYPKGIAYFKWLAGKGWDEAEAIKIAAGEKGSKVHLAIADLIKGKEVKIDSYYPNNDGQPEELTVEEYEAIVSFSKWYEQERPKILGSEFVVWGDGYAGTVDIKYQKKDGRVGLLDLKTSQYVWPEHELQLSAYKHAQSDINFLEILQIGYKRNKHNWKITEIEDKYDLFLAAKKIWANEHGAEKPKQIELPLMISLPKEEKPEEKIGAPEIKTEKPLEKIVIAPDAPGPVKIIKKSLKK